ncbi:hypothetical protein BP5796_03163 [Coleophoma crateriformis]|uniref:Uncharacterized protein n=1 Tax=Coleophoma crateriformis TaxID=565419 RepID=A0A3D8SM95_9HELO|nr:hypothetical protein BP5796_03163 [Coleophoma crateriformis]
MMTTHPAELNNGVWTSWLPVTTAWPADPTCSSAAWVHYGIQATPGFWPYVYDPAYGQTVDNELSCLPTEATQSLSGATTVSGVSTVYSLGPLVCPEAYMTVSTSVNTGSSTSVVCCPTCAEHLQPPLAVRRNPFVRNLPQSSGRDGVCTSAMTSGQIMTYAAPAGNNEASFTEATTTLKTAVPMMAVPVEGYNFGALTASSATPTASLPTTSSSTSASSTGLHQGAKIGIGVGVGTGAAIGIAIGTALLFLRRRKYVGVQYPVPASELPADDGSGEAKEMPGSSSFSATDSHSPVKQESAQEIDGRSQPAELYG